MVCCKDHWKVESLVSPSYGLLQDSTHGAYVVQIDIGALQVAQRAGHHLVTFPPV